MEEVQSPCPAPRTAPSPGWADRLRKTRRRSIKNLGKRLTRGLDRFFAAQSKVGDPPTFDTGLFPFLETLEAHWEEIRAELEPLLAHRAVISPDQRRISKGEQWRTCFLYGFGYRSERNCQQCPRTAQLLEQIPGLRTAWFSILEPGTHIRAHHGPTKGVIVFHLPLIVPADRPNCFIRVASHHHHWEPGRSFAFDDTYEHEVRNDTDEHRVVLIFHANRPMKWPGRIANRLFQGAIRRSAYIRDPLRNLSGWAERFDSAIRRATSSRQAS